MSTDTCELAELQILQRAQIANLNRAKQPPSSTNCCPHFLTNCFPPFLPTFYQLCHHFPATLTFCHDVICFCLVFYTTFTPIFSLLNWQRPSSLKHPKCIPLTCCVFYSINWLVFICWCNNEPLQHQSKGDSAPQPAHGQRIAWLNYVTLLAGLPNVCRMLCIHVPFHLLLKRPEVWKHPALPPRSWYHTCISWCSRAATEQMVLCFCTEGR